mmetsp:Transcript_134590/g.348687  ORF Transcript_134590/g.348687 Transcript_134590/m.348687 type:complete len:275 (-) Transcript_134590:1321-2145(-)
MLLPVPSTEVQTCRRRAREQSGRAVIGKRWQESMAGLYTCRSVATLATQVSETLLLSHTCTKAAQSAHWQAGRRRPWRTQATVEWPLNFVRIERIPRCKSRPNFRSTPPLWLWQVLASQPRPSSCRRRRRRRWSLCHFGAQTAMVLRVLRTPLPLCPELLREYSRRDPLGHVPTRVNHLHRARWHEQATVDRTTPRQHLDHRAIRHPEAPASAQHGDSVAHHEVRVLELGAKCRGWHPLSVAMGTIEHPHSSCGHGQTIHNCGLCKHRHNDSIP